ncbi:MAG: outer membrane lipoprotein-sorting protein [Candidatus Dadabacteria bacterium]|nr:MAG: outer membrane lipoprotein-sorting protein [Candidatus Dadabacteria bacterium]
MRRAGKLLLAVTLFLPLPAIAGPTAQDIVERVAAQPAPESSAIRVKMVLLGQRGGRETRQERTVEMFAARTPEGARSLLRFVEPRDVAGVSLLVVENPGGANDQWLYMPALKQEPRRISGGQKNASFLGTDFTFADLEGRAPGQWTHQLLREEAVDGHPAWVIESKPKNPADAPYVKTVQWVRQDNYVPVRIEFYDGRGLLKILTAEDLAQVDGYWVARRTKMENVRKKHATILEIIEQKNNLQFPPDFFSTRRMKQG